MEDVSRDDTVPVSESDGVCTLSTVIVIALLAP